MKTALVIHGNLRTFSMPIRGQHEHIYDCLVRNVVEPNDVDVFAVTDTTDFFMNGSQFFPSSRRIEIMNNDAFRLHKKVEFVEHDDAKRMIETELRRVFGERLKECVVEPPADLSQHPKVRALSEYPFEGGSSPTMIVGQFRKVKMGLEIMAKHEATPYDMVIRHRFDMYCSRPLRLSSYDWNDTDVYTPGTKGPLVYDWYAFGKRRPMGTLMSMVDNLGFTVKYGSHIMCECSRCGRIVKDGIAGSKEEFSSCGFKCPSCGRIDGFHVGDITLAAEHHTFKTLCENGIRFKDAGWQGHPYRYRESNDASIEDAVKSLGVGPVTVVNYTPSKDFSVRQLGEKA